ncbi:Protein dml1 [Steccherinum ochraceum]|uniref:Protein dml1 n=1 Tax=Steccherinum ochraceum TaxID=92696 RepID=A0A4R0RQA3_9APHY|nr:Protein dml1 [Steccherinum ochraceum]
MKEIIYIQAGNFSNFIGTHFWNAQESYFTYEDGEDSYVDHDVSFREGRTLKGEATFCPRLLLFDRKSNFGALDDGLYGADVGEDSAAAQWNGTIDEIRRPPVSKSTYQSHLDDGEAVANNDASEIRYWSDYGHVMYHPRTPQRLPDLADYENTEGDWISNREAFTKYSEDTDLMDDSFRFFGLQVMNDMSTFGGFTHSFLAAFPYQVLSTLTIAIKKALNDALCLQGLDELSTLSIPIQNPATWTRGPWVDDIDLKRNLSYHTSSLLSTHIENITLPYRLKKSQDTLFSGSALLSLRGNQRIAHLSGAFPIDSDLTDLENRLYDLSLNSAKTSSIFQTSGCIDVSRGFSEALRTSYQEWRGSWRPQPHYVDSPAISPPTSFPRYFGSDIVPPSLSAFTTLETTSRSAVLFSQYAKLANDCTKQHAAIVQQMGLEMDDVKELRDVLRALEDEYRGDEEYADGDDHELGEDEE